VRNKFLARRGKSVIGGAGENRVSGRSNWRLTFRIDRKEIEIIDLDYEDYH
jgi:hypothetical protein